MFISKVSLVNYRNFANASFKFNKGINTIIGENGSGKTNLFRAIRLLLEDASVQYAYKLEQSDFNRKLKDWRGHWIIISIEFDDISADEAIQSLFVHGAGSMAAADKVTNSILKRAKKANVITLILTMPRWRRTARWRIINFTLTKGTA